MGSIGEIYHTFRKYISSKNSDLEKSIKKFSGKIKQKSGLPILPSLKIDKNYKEKAWKSSIEFIKKNSPTTDNNGKKKFQQSVKNIKNIKKGIQKFEKEKNINLCPIEDLSSWYLDDFTKKIPAYKKAIDPKFNTPSKIRYAIERCLFNKDNPNYNPDDICGIYIPLNVTAGIKSDDDAKSNINHANMIYIEKVKKEGNKYILKMYGFDPNGEPTFYLKERMDELIEEFNKLNKDYEFEPESVFLDLKIPQGLPGWKSSVHKTGIHSFFPKDSNGKEWIDEGICGSVTWFSFILWSLVCKHTNGNFYDMYMNLCAPLAVYNQLQNKQAGEDYKKTLGTDIVKQIEDLHLKFVSVMWTFLKWSESQLVNKDYYDIWSYKKKLCYLELILHKINKHQKGNKDLISVQREEDKEEEGKKKIIIEKNNIKRQCAGKMIGKSNCMGFLSTDLKLQNDKIIIKKHDIKNFELYKDIENYYILFKIDDYKVKKDIKTTMKKIKDINEKNQKGWGEKRD